MSDVQLSATMVMLPSWGVEECAERLPALGFSGISVTAAGVAAAGRTASGAAIRRSGLTVVSYQGIDLFDVRDARNVDRHAALTELDTAAELGAGCVYGLAGPRGDRSWPDAVAALVDQIGNWLPELRARRLALAIEPIHPLRQDLSFINTVDDVLDVIRRVDAPECGFVVDTWHLWWQRQAAELIAANGQHVHAVQLSDHKAITTRTMDRAQLGDGIIPWPEMLAAIGRSGYAGHVELEIIADDNEEVGYEPVLTTAADWVRSNRKRT